ncbi:MAG TPA: hypothetical protein VIN66_13890 [Rheinheimera sp.]|uniref:hypothetical protein n=1 Tax=Rheinheimera sp. TaxID=1869214 RepID=UPI002F9410CB
MSLSHLNSTDIARALTQLQHELLLAARAHDWQRLRAMDRQLLALVQRITQAGAKDQFSAQLSALQQNYQHVLQLAKNELQRTELQMTQFHKNRPGVVAYQQTTEGKTP